MINLLNFFLVLNLFWSGLLFSEFMASGYGDDSKLLISIINLTVGLVILKLINDYER